MTVFCPYCNINTAGQHESNCAMRLENRPIGRVTEPINAGESIRNVHLRNTLSELNLTIEAMGKEIARLREDRDAHKEAALEAERHGISYREEIETLRAERDAAQAVAMDLAEEVRQMHQAASTADTGRHANRNEAAAGQSPPESEDSR